MLDHVLLQRFFFQSGIECDSESCWDMFHSSNL